MKKKNIFFGLSFCLIYNFLINVYYRPYIYSNHIDDYGLADIGNNITFIPGVYLFLYLVTNKFLFSKTKDILLHFFILSIVEILSLFIPKFGTFDFKDIFGLGVGSILLFVFVKGKQIKMKK